MKKLCLSLLISIEFTCGGAFAKQSTVDAFSACMNRTSHDRENCQSGCGMIVQQCYDEGMSEADRKIRDVNEEIKRQNGPVCERLAAEYLNEASHLETHIAASTTNLVGWIGSELALKFVKQRLHNIELIHKLCHP